MQQLRDPALMTNAGLLLSGLSKVAGRLKCGCLGACSDERLPDPHSWLSPQQGRRARPYVRRLSVSERLRRGDSKRVRLATTAAGMRASVNGHDDARVR